MPTIALADEITHPQTVTVELDLAHQYAVEGTFSDGRLMSEVTVPHYAVYNGVKQDIFCIEPGIPIDNQFTPGYEKNPLPKCAGKSKTSVRFVERSGYRCRYSYCSTEDDLARS